ncbi:hypothetical protein RvY_12924-2 [Ramazzottius varieornatus]|uniref:Uncharacterized protein n=1 Tax=Ramazzottius varieornatus TaxID=947166 RepID=A0A1D1VQ85_RAMVA|nr:hypothetical protein RvY_12924-2 [Ramazzottius varieornatus]
MTCVKEELSSLLPLPSNTSRRRWHPSMVITRIGRWRTEGLGDDHVRLSHPAFGCYLVFPDRKIGEDRVNKTEQAQVLKEKSRCMVSEITSGFQLGFAYSFLSSRFSASRWIAGMPLCSLSSSPQRHPEPKSPFC